MRINSRQRGFLENRELSLHACYGIRKDDILRDQHEHPRIGYQRGALNRGEPAVDGFAPRSSARAVPPRALPSGQMVAPARSKRSFSDCSPCCDHLYLTHIRRHDGRTGNATIAESPGQPITEVCVRDVFQWAHHIGSLRSRPRTHRHH